MRNTILKLTVASLALALSGAVLAQAPAATEKTDKKLTPAKKADAAPKAAGMEVPKPAAELSQVKFFVGTWSCKGHVPATPFGPEHSTAATVKLGPDLGGFWFTGRYDEQKTKENPMPYRFSFIWGYDTTDHKLDAWSFDSMGGYGTQESSGWDKDVLVWSGHSMMMGKKMPVRDTFTKKGDNELEHRGEAEMDGKWMVLDEETCTKAGAKK